MHHALLQVPNVGTAIMKSHLLANEFFPLQASKVEVKDIENRLLATDTVPTLAFHTMRWDDKSQP